HRQQIIGPDLALEMIARRTATRRAPTAGRHQPLLLKKCPFRTAPIWGAGRGRIKPRGRRPRSRCLARDTRDERLELCQFPKALGLAESLDLRMIGRLDFSVMILPASASNDRVKQPRRAECKRPPASMHLVAARVAFDHGQ